MRNLTPDFTLLKRTKARGVIVTARADRGEFDFVSRFFAPGAGIDEDPVTGSSHCVLGPYWAKHLGKTEFVAYQASARGGVVKVALVGDRVSWAAKPLPCCEENWWRTVGSKQKAEGGKRRDCIR